MEANNYSPREDDIFTGEKFKSIVGPLPKIILPKTSQKFIDSLKNLRQQHQSKSKFGQTSYSTTHQQYGEPSNVLFAKKTSTQTLNQKFAEKEFNPRENCVALGQIKNRNYVENFLKLDNEKKKAIEEELRVKDHLETYDANEMFVKYLKYVHVEKLDGHGELIKNKQEPVVPQQQHRISQVKEQKETIVAEKLSVADASFVDDGCTPEEDLLDEMPSPPRPTKSKRGRKRRAKY